MKIHFVGAAREVTGSCYLIETERVRFLVDCGMVQGGREAAPRNHAPFPFDPASIDFVLLTHAHIDHSGLLPKLVRHGFEGPIHTVSATRDLLEVMLRDSAHIQESDAERAARRRAKQRKPPRPEEAAIYGMADAEQALRQVRPTPYEQRVEPHPQVMCIFRDAGHILGSAIIEVWVSEGERTTKIVFSGDLGQPGRPILRDPTPIEDADLLFIESTYGDRSHKDQEATRGELAGIVEQTLVGGNVIIPAFAVGRTQEVIYHLHRLTREGRIAPQNIVVDSPMATQATRITQKHVALFDEAARELVQWKEAGTGLPRLRFTETAQESMALNNVRSGLIIISASGMCDAGRIRHHLFHNLSRRSCAVLITGYQARGTLGRRLVEGQQTVRLLGQDVRVRAKIHTVGGLSAHADREALLGWAEGFRKPPRQVFVVHGEDTSAQALASALGNRPGWTVSVPRVGDIYKLPEAVA